jgi:hypothetical protein
VSIYSKGSGFSETAREWAQKTLLIGTIPAICLFAYLSYGLFSGQLAGAAGNKTEARHAVELVNQLSFYLNISLVISLLSSLFLFYEFESLGIVLVVLAGILAYGMRFAVDFLSPGQQLANGAAATALFGEFRLAAMVIGAPGAALIIREIISRIVNSRSRQDLTSLTYGTEVAKQRDRPQALIGAFAACWQLPFCRDGIRVKCPIFLARTKCWKERVGCMCEENIILLAMGGEKEQAHDMTATPAASSGFVPIGDLLTKSTESARASIQTRVGPRGVRIPTNPHLSYAAKVQRCRNCVIYNEHQRQKYGFLSGPVTVAVPALVFWNYGNLVNLIGGQLNNLESVVAKFSFTGHAANINEVTRSLSGNLFVETVLIICMTLILMTWAQRLLEFVCFKIKI